MYASPGRTVPPSAGYGVFFLQRTTGGSWALLPATGGDVTWEQTYWHVPQSPSQAVTNLVAASLPSSPSALDKVLVEILVAVESGAPVPSEQLIGIFRVSKSPVLAAAYARFSSKPDIELACVGLQGSLVGGDVSVLSKVRQRYGELSSARSWPPLLDEIKRYYVDTTPQTIQSLGQIATDTSVGSDLRAAAAGALARMHTKQSMPYLAKLLTDPDGGLQSMAVGGLSMFANNEPIGSHEIAPGPWPYRTDATMAHSGLSVSNVSFWQTWWQQNQSALSQ